MSYENRVKLQEERNRRHEARRKRRLEKRRERKERRDRRTLAEPARFPAIQVPLRDQNGREMNQHVVCCAGCGDVLKPARYEGGVAIYQGHVIGTCAKAPSDL